MRSKEQSLRNTLKEPHYWLSALLAAALLPSLIRLHLPVAFDWSRLVVSYWLVLAVQSLFVAVILLTIHSPKRAFPCLSLRFSKNYPLALLVAVFFVVLGVTLSWTKALVLTVDTLALLEFKESVTGAKRRQVISGLVFAACYLFAGFLLVFAYNDIILSLRFFGSADAALNSMDLWLLHGWSVSRLSAWFVSRVSLPSISFLEFIYFGMFTQIGAALILCSLQGREIGLRFVGTILTAYYLALALFYLWPSQGPYYLSGGTLPRGLMVSEIQHQSLINAAALWSHKPIAFISTDYYIAFPCMHIAQPLIVMWFLRYSRRIVLILAAYDLILLPAIVLLEWHYVTDILGGVLVAGSAILLTNFPYPQQKLRGAAMAAST